MYKRSKNSQVGKGACVNVEVSPAYMRNCKEVSVTGALGMRVRCWGERVNTFREIIGTQFI